MARIGPLIGAKKSEFFPGQRGLSKNKSNFTMQNEIFQELKAYATLVVCPERMECKHTTCSHRQEHRWGMEGMPRCTNPCPYNEDHIGCFPAGKKPVLTDKLTWPEQKQEKIDINF